MSLELYNVPNGYKGFRLLACGYWDHDVKSGQAEIFVAAPTRTAADRFVRYTGLHRYLDESYASIPEASIEQAHVIVSDRGDVALPAALDGVRTALQQAAAPFMVFDTAGRLVINAGNVKGKTWLFRYFDRVSSSYKELIVEAESASTALDEIAQSPAEYGISINPLDLDAHMFGIYLRPGEKIPSTSFTVDVGSWLRLDGSITPDPDRTMSMHEPYTSATGAFWPSSVYENKVFWQIVGDESSDTPYPVQYKLASGSIVSPVMYAMAAECFTCGEAAPEMLQWDGAPDVVFCSKRCIALADSPYALLLHIEPGEKKRPLTQRIFGPIQGLPATRLLREKLLGLRCFRRKDSDVIEEIRLRSVDELPKQ